MSVTFVPESRAAGATLLGTPIPDRPDLARMRTERSTRLRDQLRRQELDALLVLGTSAVRYATGVPLPAASAERAGLLRPVALVLADDPVPHLFTPHADGVGGRLPDDHVHPPLLVDLDDAADTLRRVLAEHVGSGRLAADEVTRPLVTALGSAPANGQAVLGAVRVTKTVDELACLRIAQGINEAAMADVYPLVCPGARECDLTGAFLERCFELGASAVGIDTIWQAMPGSLDEGPFTVHGDIAYPTPSTDRVLRRGDVLWVDSGITYEGYSSDFGRTWVVGQDPSPRQEEQFQRWRDVMDASLEVIRPGTTGYELCEAAAAADPVGAATGRRPWLPHFYLAHGVGVDSAEMPLLGTDLGPEFDQSVTLAPGMVLVLEPVIWDDGAGGYRSEDIVAVTDDGRVPLSDHTYAPYGGSR